MKSYRQMLDKVKQLHAEDKFAQEIDNIVKISDQEALQAVSTIQYQMPSIPPEQWWQITTQRIEIIKQYALQKQQQILAHIRQEAETAKTNLTIALFGMGIFLLILILWGKSILLTLSRGLQALQNNMAVLNHQKDITQIQMLKEHDELGHIVNTFAKLVKDNDDYLTRMKLFYEAVKNIDQAVIMTDADNNITFVNKAFEQMSGYSKEEVLGKILKF
ncbi:PAS domain S-box protein [methane-oxidizing endosymbiont of Gigantopelta aegis]|uniref:PAS domain S-box protein n=1 Tax=methane-oxidizing endosymbiont of Gigantopelta aegis TaxID=2794938 RepID=UPI0018DE3020|nr:PAS domain S-box protein [methane-oxidizing endosymbiont of Gigantopelta aegis]